MWRKFMKALITYYSYSGITDKIANLYANILREKGEVTIQRLKPKEEITTFIGQCRAAFSRKRAELKDGVNFDVKNYDLLLLGSPVWAFAPTPVINTYLDKISGLEGKRVIVLLTSGSGAGVKKCFSNIKIILENKCASRIDEINIPNRIMSDENSINSSLEKIL
jgi:multimeric flavodoxin WrbA